MSLTAQKAVQWFKERLPVDPELLREFSSEPVSGHLKRWWWCLGGTPLYLFMIQLLTGILMTFYYVPTPDGAYESIQRINDEVAFGWYIRSMHKWSANLMIVAVLLHMMRVFFTGAYRKPREINWMIGTALLLSTLMFGFTGYSLVYEQLSYWGVTVASQILESTPLVGSWLAGFLRGGEHIGGNTLTRLFVLHIGIIPTVMIALLILHLTLIRLHGVSEIDTGSKEDSAKFPFFPDHFLTEIALGVFLMFLLTFLALVFPAGLSEKANPIVTPAHIKPEWYFFWAFRWLKLMSARWAVLTQGIFIGTIFVWPFVDGFIRKRRANSEASVWIGMTVVILLCLFTVWEALSGGGH